MIKGLFLSPQINYSEIIVVVFLKQFCAIWYGVNSVPLAVPPFLLHTTEVESNDNIASDLPTVVLIDNNAVVSALISAARPFKAGFNFSILLSDKLVSIQYRQLISYCLACSSKIWASVEAVELVGVPKKI